MSHRRDDDARAAVGLACRRLLNEVTNYRTMATGHSARQSTS